MNDDLVLGSSPWRLRFTRRGDRWSHEIETTQDGVVIPVVESVDSAVDPNWPSSPPLQEINAQSGVEGGGLILALGRAGTSHWSLSIELQPAHCRIVFDVACRLRSSAGPLGSTYRCPAAVQLRPAGEAFSMTSGRHTCRLTVEPVAGQATTLQWDGRQVVIRPAATPHSPPFTSRWRYCVSWG